jgi:hypothetical protein
MVEYRRWFLRGFADVGSTLARAGEEFTSFYRQMVRAWPLAALAALIILATLWRPAPSGSAVEMVTVDPLDLEASQEQDTAKIPE